MSTCISRHGEYGSHSLNDKYTCTLCGVLDFDTLLDEVKRLRDTLEATPPHVHGGMSAWYWYDMTLAAKSDAAKARAERDLACAEVERLREADDYMSNALHGDGGWIDRVVTLTAERDALAAQVESVRVALAAHPDPRCDKHLDDDPIKCGWKSALTDVHAALLSVIPR